MKEDNFLCFKHIYGEIPDECSTQCEECSAIMDFHRNRKHEPKFIRFLYTKGTHHPEGATSDHIKEFMKLEKEKPETL